MTFCQEIDFISDTDNIFVIGICQDFLKMPQSIVRSGRLDKNIKIDLPKPKERLILLNQLMKNNRK